MKVYEKVIADSKETHEDFLRVKVEIQSLLGRDIDADEALKCLIQTYRTVGKAQLRSILVKEAKN